jgi:hypothetical protein
MNHDDLSDEITLEEITMIEELQDVSIGSLSVNVDFNDLFASHGDDAFVIIGKLKDLLS